jgi:hypothetical protein
LRQWIPPRTILSLARREGGYRGGGEGEVNSWFLMVAAFLASAITGAHSCEKSANVLPDGNVQIIRNGPELDLPHFRKWLLKLRKQNPDCVMHIYVRTEAAFEHENGALEQIQAAGFDPHKVPID